MLKYRIDLKPSRLLVVFQLLTYVILVLSVLCWQSGFIQHQFFLQAMVVSIITFLVFSVILNSWRKKLPSVIFSQYGDWLETNIDEQKSWKITDKSRISSHLLFIHVISAINVHHSKWCLIYKDQVAERDFRRLCRAVIYQHHTSGKG